MLRVCELPSLWTPKDEPACRRRRAVRTSPRGVLMPDIRRATSVSRPRSGRSGVLVPDVAAAGALAIGPGQRPHGWLHALPIALRALEARRIGPLRHNRPRCKHEAEQMHG
jgi:hypothetical protein